MQIQQEKETPILSFWRFMLAGFMVAIPCSLTTVTIMTILGEIINITLNITDEPTKFAILGFLEEFVRGLIGFLLLSYAIRNYRIKQNLVRVLTFASILLAVMYGWAEQSSIVDFWITGRENQHIKSLYLLGLLSAVIHPLIHFFLFFSAVLSLIRKKLVLFISVCTIHGFFNFAMTLNEMNFLEVDYQTKIVILKLIFLFVLFFITILHLLLYKNELNT